MVAEWQGQGMCRGRYADLFFAPSAFEPKEDRLRREARAVAICRVCPVLEPCAEHALTVDEAFGIWGGMTEQERRRQVGAWPVRPSRAAAGSAGRPPGG